MTDDRRLVARRVFMEVADLTGSEREAALEEACGDDPDLRREVDALLRAKADAGGFMNDPTSDAADAPEAVATIIGSPREQIGQMIGPYKLLEQIGEGGFGVVWAAEQREPVKRRVALKIIKLGMDTKQVIARFEAERQALAMMDHPNIARVLDAGATETGRPFFAMELVKGVAILDYCDTEKLNTKARLDLFMKVCHAIQHAHQKGIIHRDIKPNNVLVTLHDGVPVPKVIDFGIAKATNQELTEKTIYTQHRQMIGTPAYMSPEQAEMSGLDIDTRADIYSLGVLLYELLTGTTPFDTRSLLEAGYAEMMRVIREDEPHKPSTRLSSLGETGTRTAQVRHTNIKTLSLVLKGDLDWIVMKCLEKDRTRRYETANGLAADILRHLADEPVVAGPPSATYRLRKFVRRNRTSVVAGTLVAATLIFGLVASVAGFVQANRQRELFRQEAVRAETASTFLQKMLAHVDPAVSGGRAVTVRTMLDAASERLDAAELEGQPETEASLRYTIGITYSSLDLNRAARPHLDRALELHLQVFGEQDLRTAEAMYALGHQLGTLDPEGANLFQRSFDVRRELLGEGHPKTLKAMYYAAWGRYYKDGEGAGEELHREALVLRRQCLGEDHPDTASSWNCVGVVCERTGRVDEAETLYAKALEISRSANGQYHPATLTYVANLARVYEEQGRDAAAEELLTSALPMSRMGAHNPRSLAILEQLVSINGRRGDLDRALAWGAKLKEAYRELVELSGNDPEVLNNYAWALLTIEPVELRDPDEALRAALRGNAITGDADQDYLDTLALAQHQTGDTTAAIETQNRAIALAPDEEELKASLAKYEAALEAANNRDGN